MGGHAWPQQVAAAAERRPASLPAPACRVPPRVAARESPGCPPRGQSAQLVFEIVIVGNFDEKSFARPAIATATRRAIAR